MQLKEFDILLDIKKGYTGTDIEVVQQDIASNIFNISIINGAYPYDLYETAVEIIFKKSDGKIVQQTNIEMVNAVQGKIRCALSVNTIAKAGKVEVDVRVSKAGILLTTQRFSFMVRRALLRNCDIESTSEFPILNQLIGEVNDLIDVVGGIEQQVPDNVVNAIGVLQQLTTVKKDNLVNAINELNAKKIGLSNLANNGVTTEDGFALDARYGKKLTDDVNVLSNNLVNAINELNAKKIGLSNLANNGVTTETGFALDARYGKKLTDDVTTLTNNLPNIGYTNEGIKNSIYRGKYLGGLVTASQYTAISSGTFTDLYIGDYWTIGGVNYRIAAFNYYTNTGYTLVPGNHITIVPDTQLYTHVMNDTNITTGGYIGSKMYTEGLEQAKTTIRGIFGTHLVKHKQIHSNATVDGKASGRAWVDSEVDLMSEIMVYGSVVWGESTIGGSGYNTGVGKSQLPLFRLNPRMINTRQAYWLKDVVSAAHFALVGSDGVAGSYDASAAFGVRPDFSIS